MDQQDNEGKTALMLACELNSTELSKLLLENFPCNSNVIDKHGQTAAMFAAMNDNLELLSLILSKFKVNINWQDNVSQ